MIIFVWKHKGMFKSYLASIVGFLLAAGTIVYAGLYTRFADQGNVRDTYVFNSKSIEQKLAGKTIEEITELYLPPVSVKTMKGKGNMVARYEDIKIFTRGEKSIVKGMTVTYKNGKADSFQYDEPTKDRDAGLANASPLAFFLMDKEILTKHQEPINSVKAEKWQIPIMLLLLVILANLPFFLTWPLSTMMAKKMDGNLAIIMVPLMWLLLYWIYLGIAAYAIGTAMIVVVLGAMWLLIAFVALTRTLVRPVRARTPKPSYEESYPPSAPRQKQARAPQPPRKPQRDPRKDEAVEHLRNVAAFLSLAQQNKMPVENINVLISDIATRENVDIESFKYAMANPSLEVGKHLSASRKQQFIDDLIELLVCEQTIGTLQIGLVMLLCGEKYHSEDYKDRIRDIALNKYHRNFMDDYTVIQNED